MTTQSSALRWHPVAHPVLIALTALLLLLMNGASASAATAQAGATADRWTAWLGCWQLAQEGVRDRRDQPSALDPDTLEPTSADVTDGVLVCVSPGDSPAAVKLTTFAGERAVIEESIVADGNQRPLDEPGCRGWRRTEWSEGDLRLYTRAELTCDGQPHRTVSALALMARGGMWVDIQAVEVGERESVRVRRYRRAPVRDDQSRAPFLTPELASKGTAEALIAGATPMGVDDLIEASAKISARAVEAALVETRASFNLDSRGLIALEEGGVADTVIDLMVALSYPERFVVERPTESSPPLSLLGPSGYPWWQDAAFGPFFGSMFDPFYYPLWYSDFYRYSYTPFGYSSSWRYDPYYYAFGPTLFAVQPGEGPAEAGGLAVEGRGYTRVRPREVPSDRQATRRDGSGGGGSSSAGGGSSGGSVSPQGYSGGSNPGSAGSPSGGGGRTAVPRQ